MNEENLKQEILISCNNLKEFLKSPDDYTGESEFGIKMGLCSNIIDDIEQRRYDLIDDEIYDILCDVNDFLHTKFIGWEHFSDNVYYPVPHKDGADYAYSNYNLYEGEYGEMRMKLLDYIIECCNE